MKILFASIVFFVLASTFAIAGGGGNSGGGGNGDKGRRLMRSMSIEKLHLIASGNAVAPFVGVLSVEGERVMECCSGDHRIDTSEIKEAVRDLGI